MALSLGASQKRALSMHVGHVILDFYDRDPPMWSAVGTVTQAELRRLVIKRLKEKDCADVASMLETSSLDTTVEVIKKRFKTLREKKRREEERKRGADKQAVLQVAEALYWNLIQWHDGESLLSEDFEATEPLVPDLVQVCEKESILSVESTEALLRALIQRCEGESILSEDFKAAEALIRDLVQVCEEESILSVASEAGEALLRDFVQRCEEVIQRQDFKAAEALIQDFFLLSKNYKAAKALLRDLVQWCEQENISSASNRLHKLYCDPDILPCSLFSLQTDRLLPPVVKTIVTILYNKPVLSWKACDFYFLSRFMTLACGPPIVEEIAGVGLEAARWVSVIRKTLPSLPSDLRPFSLWLLTLENHHDILFEPVWLEQADGNEGI